MYLFGYKVKPFYARLLQQGYIAAMRQVRASLQAVWIPLQTKQQNANNSLLNNLLRIELTISTGNKFCEWKGWGFPLQNRLNF